MVERGGLENRCPAYRTGGSNPSSSAKTKGLLQCSRPFVVQESTSICRRGITSSLVCLPWRAGSNPSSSAKTKGLLQCSRPFVVQESLFKRTKENAFP